MSKLPSAFCKYLMLAVLGEMLPFVECQCVQTVTKLAYFFEGGVTWWKKGSQIVSFCCA